MEQKINQLAERTYCIDGYDLHMPERTGCYVLDERPSGSVALIETGPSLSIPHIKNGLKELNISLEEIKYIIVTHIHLDHAGGAGLLLKDCPNAKVIVHPRGKRHLHDPTKLIAGARAVYGQSFDDLFEPIVPIPIDSLIEMNHLDKLHLSNERTLVFYDTPGHSRHHFSIFDNRANIFFTGDTIGIRYPALERKGVPFFLPSTSPNQFDPTAMLDSLKMIEKVAPQQIAFGHFGATNKTNIVFEQMRKWIPLFVEKAKLAYEKGHDHHELKEMIMEEVKTYLSSFHINDEDDVYETIQLDVTISAMGLLDYLQKK